MKFHLATGLLALFTTSHAFPAEMWELARKDPSIAAKAAKILESRAVLDSVQDIFEPVGIFNASEQYISTSGKYAWVAPTSTDLRGPCPGLNAFANHGYLPHNGYATITQFIDATNTVVGMGPGLAAFLAVYGAVIDGDLTAWSIGGTPPDSDLPLPPTLGKGNGITNSHNKYEGDASPTRPDLYQYGNDYKLRVPQFQQLFAMQPDASTANYDIPTLTTFRAARFQTQIQNNSYFFNGPFTGVLVQPAAYTFIFRFMANHTSQYPRGILNQNVLKSWFSITGNSGSFKWTPGHERIPKNWYRRALAYPYDQDYFLADVAAAAAVYPQFLDIGGNTGKKNSFTGVDITNLTGGVLNSQTLTQNDNFACLAYQFAANAKPDVAANSLATLNAAISTLTSSLNCPQLTKIDNSQLNMFPGYTRSQ